MVFFAYKDILDIFGGNTVWKNNSNIVCVSNMEEGIQIWYTLKYPYHFKNFPIESNFIHWHENSMWIGEPNS